MTGTPAVSVVMTFFDAQAFLHDAIRSVVAQTYERWELLLVDDGSTDGSARIAREWMARYPGRMTYLAHAGHANRGISAARNLGLRHASAEFVAFLDADDVWCRDKLDRQIALLRAHPEAAMVYGRTQYWYSWTGKPEDVARDHVPPHRFPADAVVTPPRLVTAFVRGSAAVPCICSVLVRRSLLVRLAGFEESFPGLYEDQVLYTKVCLGAPVFVSDECLERYRQHPGSVCARAERSDAQAIWRARYLRWLSRYVAEANVVDRDLSRALRTERWIWDGADTSALPRPAQRLVRRAKQALVWPFALFSRRGNRRSGSGGVDPRDGGITVCA